TGAFVFDLAHVRSTVLAVTSGWAISGDDVYFTDGNVGIGTDSPTNKFEVQTILNHVASPLAKSVVYDGDGEFDEIHDIRDFYKDGDILYVAGGSAHAVTIIDMSDPT